MPQKNDRFAHVGIKASQAVPPTPTPEKPSITPAPAASSPADLTHQKMLDQFDVAYRDTVQLNVNVSPALRKAIRLKALQEGVPVTVALRQVLEKWVESG